MNKQVKTGMQSILVMMLAFGIAQAQAPLAVPAGPISVAPNASAAPVLSPPVAAPVAVTPEMRAAIKELLDLTKFKDNMRGAYQSMAQGIPAQMGQMMSNSIQQNASLSDEQKKQVRERLSKSFEPAAKEAIAALQDPKLVEEATNNIYPIYAKYFTVAEIRQMVAFYKTPIGIKSVTTMPLVVTDGMRGAVGLLQPRVMPIMENLLKKEIEAVQKK